MNELVTKFGEICGLCSNFELDVIEFGNYEDITILQSYIEAIIKVGVDIDKVSEIQLQYKDKKEQADHILKLMQEFKVLCYNKICDIETNLDAFKKVQKIENMICQALSLNHEKLLYGYILVAEADDKKIYYHAHEYSRNTDKPFMIEKPNGKKIFTDKISTCCEVNNSNINWANNNLNKITQLGGIKQ